MSCEHLRGKKITTCKGNIKSINTQNVQFSPVRDRPNTKETNLWVNSDKNLYFGSRLVTTVAPRIFLSENIDTPALTQAGETSIYINSNFDGKDVHISATYFAIGAVTAPAVSLILLIGNVEATRVICNPTQPTLITLPWSDSITGDIEFRLFFTADQVPKGRLIVSITEI